MLTSKLTVEGQTTIPPEVRQALGLKPGDGLAYQIHNGRVMLHAHVSSGAVAGCLRDKVRRPIAEFADERREALQAWSEEAGREGLGD